MNLILILIRHSDAQDYIFWLGATDVAQPGTWIWESTKEPLTYTNWEPSEPNNPGSCLEMWLDQLWVDQGCERVQSSICQQMVEV